MMKSSQPVSESRRSFLRLSVGFACTSLLRGQDKGQAASSGLGESGLKLPQPKLVKEFRDAYFMAISPDGGKMCLYFTKHPQIDVRHNSAWRPTEPTTAGPAQEDEALRVIEMGLLEDASLLSTP